MKTVEVTWLDAPIAHSGQTKTQRFEIDDILVKEGMVILVNDDADLVFAVSDQRFMYAIEVVSNG